MNILCLFRHKWKYSSRETPRHGDERVCMRCDQRETFTVTCVMCGGELDAWVYKSWKKTKELKP